MNTDLLTPRRVTRAWVASMSTGKSKDEKHPSFITPQSEKNLTKADSKRKTVAVTENKHDQVKKSLLTTPEHVEKKTPGRKRKTPFTPLSEIKLKSNHNAPSSETSKDSKPATRRRTVTVVEKQDNTVKSSMKSPAIQKTPKSSKSRAESSRKTKLTAKTESIPPVIFITEANDANFNDESDEKCEQPACNENIQVNDSPDREEINETIEDLNIITEEKANPVLKATPESDKPDLNKVEDIYEPIFEASPLQQPETTEVIEKMETESDNCDVGNVSAEVVQTNEVSPIATHDPKLTLSEEKNDSDVQSNLENELINKLCSEAFEDEIEDKAKNARGSSEYNQMEFETISLADSLNNTYEINDTVQSDAKLEDAINKDTQQNETFDNESKVILIEDTPLKPKSPKITMRKPFKKTNLDVSQVLNASSVLEKSILKRRKRSLSTGDINSTFQERRVQFHSPANTTVEINLIDERLMKSFMENNGRNIRASRRKRSMSDAGTTEFKSKTKFKSKKMPDFKAIHDKQFKQMESIVENLTRKQERAITLTTPNSPKIGQAFKPVGGSSKKKQLKYSEPENIKNPHVVKQSEVQLNEAIQDTNNSEKQGNPNKMDSIVETLNVTQELVCSNMNSNEIVKMSVEKSAIDVEMLNDDVFDVDKKLNDTKNVNVVESDLIDENVEKGDQIKALNLIDVIVEKLIDVETEIIEPIKVTKKIDPIEVTEIKSLVDMGSHCNTEQVTELKSKLIETGKTVDLSESLNDISKPLFDENELANSADVVDRVHAIVENTSDLNEVNNEKLDVPTGGLVKSSVSRLPVLSVKPTLTHLNVKQKLIGHIKDSSQKSANKKEGAKTPVYKFAAKHAISEIKSNIKPVNLNTKCELGAANRRPLYEPLRVNFTAKRNAEEMHRNLYKANRVCSPQSSVRQTTKILKGVRTNRRFELQMAFRNMSKE